MEDRVLLATIFKAAKWAIASSFRTYKDGEPNVGFKPLSERPKRSIKGKKYFSNLYIFCYDGNDISIPLLRMRLPRFYQKIFLVCLAVLLAFGIVEIFLRIVDATGEKRDNVESVQCKILDPILVHSFVPLSSCQVKAAEWDISYKINPHSLRDVEHSWEKPENTYRILIVGDSYTEGQGVELEEIYGRILENKLNEQSYQKVEVILTGIAGWSPLPEYIYLAKYGIKYQPDLVILTLNTTDFHDEYFHESVSTNEAKNLLENTEDDWRKIAKSSINFFSVGTVKTAHQQNISPVARFKVFLTADFKTFHLAEVVK